MDIERGRGRGNIQARSADDAVAGYGEDTAGAQRCRNRQTAIRVIGQRGVQ